MSFSSNVKLLRKRKGRTQDEVANALEMKRSTLSGYENNVAKPSVDVLIAFSGFFNISIDTLVKIDLAELSESQLSEIERGYDVFVSGSKLRVLTTTVDSKNRENIELVPEKAKAGYQNGFSDPEYIRDLPTFQFPFLSRERKYRTFQLSGDSMLPIPDKSWVTGEFVQDWMALKSNQAYIVLTLDEGIVFKVVENLIEKEKKLRLHSLNPVYEPYDLNVNQIKEIWKFIHYISAELPDPVFPKEELVTTVARLKQDMEMLKGKFL